MRRGGQTFFRCRPTLTSDPPNPSATPKISSSNAWPNPKKWTPPIPSPSPLALNTPSTAGAEEQRGDSAEQPLERAFEEERAANEPVGGADQAHDLDLAGALQHGHPDGDADDHHRDQRERKTDGESDQAGEVAQGVESLHPVPAVPDVLDEIEAPQSLGHLAGVLGVAELRLEA